MDNFHQNYKDKDNFLKSGYNFRDWGYLDPQVHKMFCAWARKIDDKIVPGNDVCWEPKREFVHA